MNKQPTTAAATAAQVREKKKENFFDLSNFYACCAHWVALVLGIHSTIQTIPLMRNTKSQNIFHFQEFLPPNSFQKLRIL